MGIFESIVNSGKKVLGDQWKEIITVDKFNELDLLAPAILKTNDNNSNIHYTDGVISNGSKIYVPENTAAFVFDKSGIEQIITEPGEFIYNSGQKSVFNGDGIFSSLVKESANRFKYGSVADSDKKIAFVNLREIRNIKFGTKGSQIYNDLFYGVDLELHAFGHFSIQVVDPEILIKNFIPANVTRYSFNEYKSRELIVSEFMQSFIMAINSLSNEFRISQIASRVNNISEIIIKDQFNAGSWPKRFGFRIIKVSIENIELTAESKELIRKYSTNKLNVKAYENLDQQASNIASQQLIAEGIRTNGFGDAGGMIMGMNMANSFIQNTPPTTDNIISSNKIKSIDEQIEILKKLKDLVDSGILTQEEFDVKKKEILGL